MDDYTERIPMGHWLSLSNEQQDAVVRVYLEDRAAGRVIVHGRSKRPSKRQLDEAHRDEPAFPSGQPSDRWSSESLAAYAEHGDRQIEADAVADVPPIDLNRLAPEQLKAIARCTSPEQVAAVEAAIRNGKKLPRFKTSQVDDREAIVAGRWSKI